MVHCWDNPPGWSTSGGHRGKQRNTVLGFCRRSLHKLETVERHRQCCMQQGAVTGTTTPRHHMQESWGLNNHRVLDKIHSFTVISWTPEPIRPTVFLSALTVCSCNRGYSRGGNAVRDLVRGLLALLTGAIGQWAQYIRTVNCMLCSCCLALKGTSVQMLTREGGMLTSLMHSRTSSSPAVSADR